MIEVCTCNTELKKRLLAFAEKYPAECRLTDDDENGCLRYILGFSDGIHIGKHNIRLCDTLKFAKNGTMEEELKKLFDL